MTKLRTSALALVLAALLKQALGIFLHDKVVALLVEAGRTPEQARACLALAEIRTEDTSFVEQVRALGVEDELLEEPQ